MYAITAANGNQDGGERLSDTAGGRRVSKGIFLSTGNVLFISAQCMPAFAGAVLLALVGLQGLLLAALPWRRRRGLALAAGQFHGRRTLYLIAVCGGLFAVQAALLPHGLKAGTAAHLLVYLLVIFGARSMDSSWPSISLVRVSVWLNALLLASYFVPALREIFWYENLGQYRFRSFYFEPSIAALMYVLNLLMLWSHTSKVRDAALLTVLSALCLALTYSGSGMLMLAALMLTGFRWKQVRKFAKLALGVVPVLVIWAITPTGTEAIQELILSRATGILALEYDNSVHLRAVAPILFLWEMVSSPVTAALGAGIGGIESFVLSNESAFWYLTDFSGEQLTAINNGYVVIMALLGIPLALAVLFSGGIWLWRSPAPRGLKVFLALYPFLSGFVIHPLIWLLVAMVGLRASHSRKCRPPDTSATCASPC